ncbi:hypothetical protein [Streptomyces marokkonensis]|uniref:hypothetical protein n=1 Tax=Streptomyces marokkonensis TaxID=324855 RepID=UPI0031F0BB21
MSDLRALERLYRLYDDLERSHSAVRKQGYMSTGGTQVKELTECGPLKSQSSVHYQLRELEAKGTIVRERHRARGNRLR